MTISKAISNQKITLFVLSLLAIFYPAKVKAGNTTLSLSPPVVEVMVAPNKKLTQSFSLELSSPGLTITPTIHLVKPSDDVGHVTIDQSPVQPETLELALSGSHPLGVPFQLESNRLSYELTIDAATVDVATDIYLALVFEVSDPSSSSDRLPTTTTVPGISSLIMVTINPSGILPINLEIKDFSLPLFHDSYLDLSLNPSLKNNVPIMIRPVGKFEVISPTGKTISSSDLYPNLLLGDSSRSIQQISSDKSPAPLSWHPTYKNIGPHRLILTISTQGGTKLTQVEKIIWVLPIRLSLMLVVPLTFIIWVLLPKKSRAKLDS